MRSLAYTTAYIARMEEIGVEPAPFPAAPRAAAPLPV